MELLVIDDKYPEAYLAIFAKNGIRYPKEGQIVELLRVVNYPKLKRKGFVVAPFQGQFLSGVNEFGIEGSNEVDFNSKRFAHLDKNEITEEEINQFKKVSKEEKVLIPKKEEEERIQ